VQFDDFVADEVCFELRMSWHGAADRICYACDLAGRLPVTFAALGAGLIDPVHAKIIAEQTFFLSAAAAARADPLLAAAAQKKAYAELRAAAGKLVLTLDPEAAERRKQARRKNDAHVRPFREESGNAGMVARELPSDEVLASSFGSMWSSGPGSCAPPGSPARCGNCASRHIWTFSKNVTAA
jgi:hypothetical protein